MEFRKTLMINLYARQKKRQDKGSLGLVHWDDPEAWYGEGGGRRVQMGNTCIPVADSF